MFLFFVTLNIYFLPCLGRRFTSISNNSSPTPSSWFFSLQDSFDSRTLSKTIIGILIIILALLVTYLIIKIIRRYCLKRKVLPPPTSPVYSISSDPMLTINNISVIINSYQCCNTCNSDFVKDMDGIGSEEHLLAVVKEQLGLKI